MNLDKLMAALDATPNAGIQIILPDGAPVPAHFHVTEVGLVRKDFIDCGGTVRSSTKCVLQVWVADDALHRLNSAKLAKILRLAAPLLKSADLPVEVEYEQGVISQYPLDGVQTTADGLQLQLGSKHTACLATELCIINPCC